MGSKEKLPGSQERKSPGTEDKLLYLVLVEDIAEIGQLIKVTSQSV